MKGCGSIQKKRYKHLRSNVKYIYKKDNKIYYRFKLDGCTEVMTYNDDLYDILQNDCLSPFRDNGRLRFSYQKGGVRFNIYLYDLAIGCYQGMIKADTYIQDIQEYYNQKYGLSVDHADCNIHNNTLYNLSLMDISTNSCKGSITSRVKLPNSLVVAYVNNDYRVAYKNSVTAPDKLISMLHDIFPTLKSVQHTEITAQRFYICVTPDDLVDCLRTITLQNIEGCERVRTEDGKTWLNQNSHVYSNDLKSAVAAQEMIATMPVERFQKWEHSMRA